MRKSSVLLLLCCCFLAVGFARSWTQSFRFPAGIIASQATSRDGQAFEMLTARSDPGLSRLNAGVRYLAEPGQPLLPSWTFTLVIPQGMRVAAVEAVPVRTAGLELRRPVMPAQPPVPFSQSAPPFTPPDPAIYSADAAWPGRYAQADPVGVKSGFRLATVNLYPLQYRPAGNVLTIATELEVTVRYEPDPAARPGLLTGRQLRVFGAEVRALVANPADVDHFAPARRDLDFGEYDCVIVTSDALQSYFQPLVDWRVRKGFTTVVRTVAWIAANYSGRDNQERIRNFVRDYYTNHGTTWLLLGGDNSVVPCRQARAVVGSYTGNIPCDLYYADLEWSWDGDNDNIFGEAGQDTVDFYYDLYVGRASVDNQTEAQTFCSKVLTHEQNPPTDYLRRILLVDAELWSGYNDEQSNDSIANITPAGWSDVRFHDPTGTTAVRDSLNHGFQFCHLVGHGNDVGIYNGGTAYYGNSVIAGHNNASRVGLINSIACYPGNFETSDCLAEMTHNCTTGGALAVIFNSRYGWGPGPGPNPPGPSELLDVRFYDYFFNHDTMPVGVTHAASKEVYRGSALGTQVWRWCYYELNLFTDPLLMMYEQVPTALSAAFPSPISTGSQSFTVTVTAGGSPVEQSLVCVHKGSEVYDRGYTNVSGQVTFTINPATAGYLRVTATAANHLPDLDSSQVVITSRDAGCYRIVSPSGTVDSGTVVTPRAMVRNYSTVPLASIPVRFHIGTAYADTQTIVSLGAGDSVQVTFDNWSSRTGSYALTCSTMLTGDAVPSNDRSTGTLLVRFRDVGTVSVSATSPVDSGAGVPIVATVRNYGNVDETFNVQARVGGTGYSQTRSKTLAAGIQDTVVFPAWTANGRGTYTVACSTVLAADMRPTNNRATTSVIVHVHNVCATVILSPTGTIDSTATVPVRARVRNLGNQTESFQVLFSIAGGAAWTNSVNVNSLAPGESVQVNFADWTVGPRGGYTAACSTMLGNDLVRANDRVSAPFSVRVRDVAARAVISPTGTVDSGATVAVRVVTANNGSTSENIKTVVSIGSGGAPVYRDSATRPVAPGAVDTFNLGNWPVRAPRGAYAVTCSTYVPNDRQPGNNVLRSPTAVRVNDVACLAIVAPTGTVDSGTVVTPQARVSNPGSVSQSFNVRLTVSDGYLSERTVDLGPGRDSLVSFASWAAGQVGTFTTRCSTMLPADANPTNDCRTGTVMVVGTDVALSAILAPAAQVDPGPVDPSCRVTSYAPLPVSFWTFCRIIDSRGTPVYYDSSEVLNLLPDSSLDLVFGTWTATMGSYTVRCSAGLADRLPANDTLSAPCLVVTHDVGLVTIVSPASVLRPMAVVPLLRVTNYGNASDYFPVEMVIVDSVSGATVYHDSASVTYLLPGERRDVRLPTWNADAGWYRCAAWTRLAGDVDRANDSGRVRVKVTWGEIGWQQRPDMPSGIAPVKHGASLARMEDAGLIYALKGNKTGEFYCYNPAAAAWTTLPSLPAGPSGRPVNKSGDLCTDDARYVYALKGNRTCEFWRYDTRDRIWEQMADVPAGAKTPRTGSGIACVTRGDSVLVFCLKASNTLEFYSYDAGTNQWTPRADAPGGPMGKRFKNGSALCAASADRLYAVKSKENEFYAYSVAGNGWTQLAALPLYAQSGKRSACKDGCDLAPTGDGAVYAFSGGNREFFFRYDESAGDWSELASLPLEPSGKKVKAGGTLTVLGKQCWALKGSNTCEFWVYTPDTMAFAPPRPERSGVAASPQAFPAREFVVSPRICRDRVNVLYSPPAGAGPSCARLTLLSPLGRAVREQTIQSGSWATLDMVRLPAGTYFLRLETPAAVRTQKLVLRD